MAKADFDRDGDVDLIITNYKDRAHYYVNKVAKGHWLQIRLRGRQSNRDGVGSIIRIRARGDRQMRVISAGDGYASQFSRVAHYRIMITLSFLSCMPVDQHMLHMYAGSVVCQIEP